MGRPLDGVPILWAEIKKIMPTAQFWAAQQVLNLWIEGQKKRGFNQPFWGDELEYDLVHFDHLNSRAFVYLDQERILDEWEERRTREGPDNLPCLHAEYTSYMIEATPASPYDGSIEGLLSVEQDMRQRRVLLKQHLHPNQHLLSITVFPTLGTPSQFTFPHCPPAPTKTRSALLPTQLCSPTNRYIIMDENLHSNRGGRFETYVPIFRDVNTVWPFWDETIPPDQPARAVMAKPKNNHVYLDGLSNGPGSCCVQTTFQTPDEESARWLHDQLIPLGPVMLAISAATPIYKGYLVDTDVRWNVAVSSHDDRNVENPAALPSRYSCNTTYISQDPRCLEEYRNPPLPVDPTVKKLLQDGGMDEPLASHFAQVFSHPPLCLTNRYMENASRKTTDIFDAFQSGFYQHVRFKPPPLHNEKIGWRVEFRPLEAQPRDFESAALTIFMFLLSRAILVFDLNFYVPIGEVIKSMDTAHRRQAVLNERLSFRRYGWSSAKFDRFNCDQGQEGHDLRCRVCRKDEPYPTPSAEPYAAMTVDEIINGEHDTPVSSRYPGLMSFVRDYLCHSKASSDQKLKLEPYLSVVSERASGKLPTPAAWIRSFVGEHGDYKGDSVVSQRLCYDLLKEISALNDGV